MLTRLPFLVAGLMLVVSTASGGDAVSVEAAIEAAVRARVGESVEVTIEQLRVVTPVPLDGVTIVAEPQPGSQVGARSRFALRAVGHDGRWRVGAVECVVRLAGPVVRMRHDVPRGHVLAASDLDESWADVGRLPLQDLATAFEGQRARRPLKRGEQLRTALVEPVAVVRSGDRLRVRVRIDQVEISAVAVASQHGEIGDIIRAVNADTGRRLRVRVTGPAEGEVIDAR